MLTFCALSIGQTSVYLQDYYRGKAAAFTIFQLMWRKSEIDPFSKSGFKPVNILNIFLHNNLLHF